MILVNLLFHILILKQNDNTKDEIRRIVKQIDLDSGLISKEKPTEFGKLIGYYKGKELVKVYESYSESCCDRFDKYYYNERKLIFLESCHNINFKRNNRDTCNKTIQNPSRKMRFYNIYPQTIL